MYRLYRSSHYESETADIAQYVGRDNLDAALRFLDAVAETENLIVQWPKIGSAVMNVEVAGLRRFSVKRFRNFVVLYQVINEEIRLLRLVHGARGLTLLSEDR